MREFFDKLARNKRYWKTRNNYYNRLLRKFFSFNVEPNKKILELGCGGGFLIDFLKPSKGVGIDISYEMIKFAKNKFPQYEFYVDNAENPTKVNGVFDYIIASDLLGHLEDIVSMFRNIRKFFYDDTRFIITFYNYLWEPVINLLEFLHLKIPQKRQNWLTMHDVENLLKITGYSVVNRGRFLLFPMKIPVLSWLLNFLIAKIPVIDNFCLIQYIIARKLPEKRKEFSCSVIVPCLNEKGNIEEIVRRIPIMGKDTEIIFVDGGSDDGTFEEIERMIEISDKKITLIHQGGKFGKADAVRKGFSAAKNELLMILDADITVDPECLVQFYEVIAEGRGEFVNGSRLVYPLEKESMRFLNIIGNKFFSIVFSYLLNQKIKDTLCGTKVLTKKNWKRVEKVRVKYFGDLDPFGDFDLLFGAAKLNLDIVELPVRYRPRKYGDIKIQRFKHGLLLLKMSWIGFKKLKLFSV